MPIWTGALAGLVAGVAYGLAGFWKNKRDDKATFEWKPFLITVIPAGIIGGLLGLLQMPSGSENIGLYLDGTAGLTITAILRKLLRV